jgi:hypothetical protein
MPTDRFFKLDESKTIVEWIDQSQFQASLKEPEVTDRLYRPDLLKKADRFRSIADRTFRNVSFSKTTIRGLSFTNCEFYDCLFIDSEFERCEFHHCRFVSCNFWKATFKKCYANPWQFREAVELSRYANVGVGLFRSLATNAFIENQREHQAEGEFYFRRSLRHQLKHDRSKGKISRASYLLKYLWSVIFEWTAGYGWRTSRVAVTITSIFLVLVFLNHVLWPRYDVKIGSIALPEASVNHSFFYTTSILTTLGPGAMAPSSELGMLSMALQAIVGVLLFALVASIFFRVVVRR